MTEKKLPLYRSQAKVRARSLQRDAKAEGKALSYTQALVEVAKEAGYANVHEMIAAYVPEPARLKGAKADPRTGALTPHDPREDLRQTLQRVREGLQETWPGLPTIRLRDTYGDLVCDFPRQGAPFSRPGQAIAWEKTFADPRAPLPEELEAFYGKHDQSLFYPRQDWLEEVGEDRGIPYWVWLADKLKSKAVFPVLSVPGSAGHLLEVLQHSTNLNRGLPMESFLRALQEDIRRSYDPFIPADGAPASVKRALDHLIFYSYATSAELFNQMADVLIEGILIEGIFDRRSTHGG